MHFEAKANLGSPLQPASMFATTNTTGNSNISVGDFFLCVFLRTHRKFVIFLSVSKNTHRNIKKPTE